MRLLRRLARGLLYSVLVATTLLLLTVLALRWVNPPASAFMIEASLTALRAGEHDYATHYQWVDLEQISPQAALAVIASEDQQFPFHGGFVIQSSCQARRHHAPPPPRRRAPPLPPHQSP